MSIDLRDFAWWERKARIRNVKRKIDALGTARLAAHGEESFDRQIRDLVDQVELWERPQLTDEQIIGNWEAQLSELKGSMEKAKKKMRR